MTAAEPSRLTEPLNASQQARWSLVGQLGRQILQFAALAVLARRLGPDIFGLVAMALVVVSFASMLPDMGLVQHLTVVKDLSEERIGAANWVAAGVGILTAALALSISPIVASFYGEPRLAAVLQVLSAMFIFQSLSIAPRGLLVRQMRIKPLVIVDLCAVGFSAMTAILATRIYTRSDAIEPLIIYYMATPIASGLVLRWVVGESRKWSTSAISIRAVLSGSSPLAAANVTNFFARQADNALVGRWLGPSALGVYSQAYRILMAPVAQLNAALGRVLLPRMAEQWRAHPGAAPATVERYLRLVLIPSFLAAVALFAAGTGLVLLLLGRDWVHAGQVLEILGLSVPFQSAGVLTAWALQSQAPATTVLKVVILNTSFFVAAFVITVPLGLSALASGYVVASGLALAPAMIALSRYGGPSAWVLPQTVLRVGWPFGAGLLLLAVTRHALGYSSVTPGGSLLSLVTAMGPAMVSPTTRSGACAAIRTVLGRA